MEKVNYNFGAFKKVGTTVVGVVEGWTFQPKEGNVVAVREVTVKGETKKIATFTVSTTQAKSKMKFNFGDAFEKEQHFLEVNVWDNGSEYGLFNRLVKYNPEPKMLLSLFGEVKTQEFKRNDGTTGSKLIMNLEDFKALTKKKGTAQEPVEPEVSAPQADMNIPF